MIRIAITGGIACGKSLVGEIFSKSGVSVCDTDDLAHSLLDPGSSVYNGIIKEFGENIVDENGNIDRRKLGEIIFSDEKLRLVLNKLMHPAVKDLFELWLAEHATECAAAVMIPLLYEAGMDKGWDAVVSVSCSEDVQMHRLKNRGLSEAEARQRISAQLPTIVKMERADFVIFNDGTVSILKKQVEKVLRHILEK